MTGRISTAIREFLLSFGPATPERVAEVIPALAAAGGAERALLLMRLDPTLERTNGDMWAARDAAISAGQSVRKALEDFLNGRPGAPMASALKAVASHTGLPEHQVREQLTAQFIVVGTNIFNRRR